MNGTLNISVAKDMMHATMYIHKDGETLITKEYILNTLKSNDIKAGIHMHVIDEILHSGQYNTPYVIATGKDATQGTEGYYEYFFDINNYGTTPKIRKDGTVDYSIRHVLVNAGDLIATYHPAKPGFFGYTVHANVIAPVPVKNKSPLHLYGVKRNNNNFYALTNGEVTLDNNLLKVNEKLTIDGNADTTTGTIIFNGDVYVTGDVLTDAKIIADGNVIIDGVVEAAHIEAGKDIIIKHGIHGRNKAFLKAKGSIYAYFIKESRLEAGKDIVFNNVYVSELLAKKQIIAEGKPGSIIGGTNIAGESITAQITGNRLGIATYLFITSGEGGISPLAKIVVEKKIYPGTEIRIDNVKYNGLPEKTGEFHLLHREVLYSEVGKFEYTLEAKQSEAAPTPFVIKKKQKPTILLVDDEPIILKTFYSYLSNDYNVLAVSSAGDAFALMESLVPDLILLDYMMPNMDGGQMLEYIRKATWKNYYKVPVIFVTAMTSKNVITKCLSLYPQGYLIKPLGQIELLSAVDHFFQNNG